MWRLFSIKRFAVGNRGYFAVCVKETGEPVFFYATYPEAVRAVMS